MFKVLKWGYNKIAIYCIHLFPILSSTILQRVTESNTLYVRYLHFRRIYMFKRLQSISAHLPHQPLNLASASKPTLRSFTSTPPFNMPLITSTGKPRVILGTMTMGYTSITIDLS